jgi:hypothetical protein
VYNFIAEENIPVFYVGTRRVGIPTQLSGVVVENEAHFIIFKLTGTGLTLKWDGQVKHIVTHLTHIMSVNILAFNC